MHKATSQLDRAWQASHEGRPLPSGLRDRFEHALGADLSAVRVHTGPEADAAARAHDADAIASGSGLFFRDGAYRPDNAAGLHLLAHEVAHTVQQAGSADAVAGGGYGATVHWEGQADRFADSFIASRMFSLDHRSGAAATNGPIQVPAGPSSAAVVQRHASFEHRAMGDLEPQSLYQIATGGPSRDQTLRQQIALMELFKNGNPRSVTPAQMKAVDPTLEILAIGPDKIVATLGEINALPDYFANPEEIDKTPAEPLLNILQLIRQDTYNKFVGFLTDTSPNVQFPLSPYKPIGWSAVDAITETSALDRLTAGMGVAGQDHYSGLLARNACHFAPYSWHRWGFFNALARSRAKEFHATKRPELRAEALRFAGYADHFLEDSFAAGHLIDKTLVMQWFVQWAKQSELVADDAILQYMTAALQPGLQAGKLYDPTYTGPSHDPQTVQELKTMALRVSGTRLKPGREQARFRGYLDYLTFLTSGVAQIATAELHDYYNKNSLWVASPANPNAYEIYGDDTFFTGRNGGNGVMMTSATAKLSRTAVYEILEKGVTNVSAADVRAHFPTRAGSTTASMKPLQQWVADQQGWVEENIFRDGWDRIVELVLRLVSPRTGIVSRDQQLAAKWYSPMGEGIIDYQVDVLPSEPERLYGTSEGWLYELDARSGQRIPNRKVQVADLGLLTDKTTMLAVDDTYVFVGVAGYVHAVARKGDWTKVAWTTKENLGGRDKVPRPVSLQIVQGRLFAGCHGYVYELDRSTGAIKQTGELGNDAVDAAYPVDFATDGVMLFAGTHGYSYGLSLKEPWAKWGRGGYVWNSSHLDNFLAYQPVALLSAEGRLWAASNGWVYELSPHSGAILKESQFDTNAGLLSRYAHMAVDGGRLYLGSHGRAYAFALDGPWEKKNGEEWRSERLSVLTDHAPATMLYLDDRLFVACDGYLYELDLLNGAIIETWLLTTELATGLDFTMALAVSDANGGYAGLHGYAYGLMLNSLDAAPTAAWRLAPQGDGTPVPDQRGIHPATAKGITWQTLPAVGGCAVFNGVLSSVETMYRVVDTTPGKSFTVSAWVRLDQQPSGTDYAVLSQTGQVVSGFTLGYSGTERSWVFERARADAANPLWDRVSAKTPAQIGVWTHIAAVYDTAALTDQGTQYTEMRIYVNGTRRGAEPVDPKLAFAAGGPFQIGVARFNRQPVERLKGAVRDVRVYDRALDDLLLEPQSAAFWRLDDGSGDVAHDVRRAHDATAEAITWEWITRVGYVANFNGKTSGVSTKTPVVNTGSGGSFTVAAWVRVAGGLAGTLLGQDGAHCSAFNFSHVSTRPNTARWYFTRSAADRPGSQTVTANTGVDITNGTWAHLAGVYDASQRTMAVYLNGEQRDVVVYQNAEWPSDGPFTIGFGKFNSIHSSELNGGARDVRAYNQALSAQQIKDLLDATGLALGGDLVEEGETVEAVEAAETFAEG